MKGVLDLISHISKDNALKVKNIEHSLANTPQGDVDITNAKQQLAVSRGIILTLKTLTKYIDSNAKQF